MDAYIEKKYIVDIHKLKYRCKKKKINMNELSYALGVHRNTIWTWTKELTCGTNVLLMAKFLECDMSDIIKEG